ncbi:hypothetical protein GW17_00043721 [Ensete ventricosum]|nr:hypothetical protein GW17_00043721 [Ensete ventricosum]
MHERTPELDQVRGIKHDAAWTQRLRGEEESSDATASRLLCSNLSNGGGPMFKDMCFFVVGLVDAVATLPQDNLSPPFGSLFRRRSANGRTYITCLVLWDHHTPTAFVTSPPTLKTTPSHSLAYDSVPVVYLEP